MIRVATPPEAFAQFKFNIEEVEEEEDEDEVSMLTSKSSHTI